MRLLVVLILASVAAGCSRSYYRRSADKETYHAIEERNHDPRWAAPRVSVEPPPESRFHDPADPDRPPLPPDDPAAYRYMECANGMRGSRRWHKDGDAPWIEDPAWQASLSLREDGVLDLTPERAVELGLLHSREYQTQLEVLYLNSLALTLNRFEFALHWFATNSTTFSHFGSSPSETNTFVTSSDTGFSRSLATGGQLMVDFANSFVFQFRGVDHMTVSSNILINLVQPLLRNAGRAFRLENLTEAERGMLYAVRDFARFRKQFSFDIATATYLQLLSQEQQIRNARANLGSLEQNYRLHQALFASGNVSGVKVDQVFLSVQQGELDLIQSEARLETAQDSYKNQLGLPPGIPVHLDDSLLAPFQLNDPALTDLQAAIDDLLARYRKPDQPPALADLRDGFRKLSNYRVRTQRFVEQIKGEIARWQPRAAESDEDRVRAEREREAKLTLAKDLEFVQEDLGKLDKQIDKAVSALAENKRKEGWEAIQRQTQEQSAAAAQLFVIQTQVRVQLIKLKPLEYDIGPATEYAIENRLDLMNQRGRVVDAWRQITVTANQLLAGLDVVFGANIANPPGSGNPVDFRASASSYSVGFRFDSPLNRVAERNAYRASQIRYQQSRRSYMALEDQIERSLRFDLRQLKAERLSFEIARQSLIAAARQVESARADLLNAVDPTSTQNILIALNAVLSAKNGLIQNWVQYETTRIQLLLDMEALQLDERGIYTDGHTNESDQPAGSGGHVRAQTAQARP